MGVVQVQEGQVILSMGNLLSNSILTLTPDSIILKVGPSTLTMDNTGVTIKAPTITYQAQTTMDIKAGATMKLVGMMIMIN